MTKFLDKTGLAYFWEKIKAIILGKADKVANATSGNLASLDSDGNLTDSGYSPSDLASQEVLICNYNGSTCDKTTQEIYDAKVAGKIVTCTYIDTIYYLITATNSSCVFRAILNQGSILSFSYIKCLNGSWSMGSESWSSKANVSSTPQTTLVTDITALTAEQLNALKLGDIVIKSLDGGYNNHTYTVSYKNGSLGECSLVYSSYDMIEEVSYKKVNNAWTYIETKQRIF